MDIGSLIYMFRKQRNLSRKDLAKGICDESTIRRIESGKQEPRIYTLLSICKKLGISPYYLLPLHTKKELLYIQKIKKLSRNFVYLKDYDALTKLLEDCEAYYHAHLENDTDFFRFIQWHKGILDHKKKKNPLKAKERLMKLLHNSEELFSEVDIGIANSIGLIQIELKEINKASKTLQIAFQTFEHIYKIEDTSLYVRVGYNYALSQYKQRNYKCVIKLCYKLLNHLEFYHLKYLIGHIHHLLSLTFDQQEKFEESEKHMKKATEYFLAESKLHLYLRAMRSLLEVQIRSEKVHEAIETLNSMEKYLCELENPKELYDQLLIRIKSLNKINTSEKA